jgi:hypothetical protein
MSLMFLHIFSNCGSFYVTFDVLFSLCVLCVALSSLYCFWNASQQYRNLHYYSRNVADEWMVILLHFQGRRAANLTLLFHASLSRSQMLGRHLKLGTIASLPILFSSLFTTICYSLILSLDTV